mgnify:CR=1 FL=1
MVSVARPLADSLADAADPNAWLAGARAGLPAEDLAQLERAFSLAREQYADRVSSELERAEQSARQKAEWEKRQKEEAARRADMEEERRVQERVARERMRWQQELQR